MTTLFAEVVSAVTATLPLGDAPKPVVVKEEQPDTPALYRLIKRLNERRDTEGAELRNQLEELQGRLDVEEEVIKRFADYDLKSEAKKADFDRTEATKLQSEALIAQEVAHGISDEIASVQKNLKSIKERYAKLMSRLNDFVKILDDIRRSTVVGYVQGKGRLLQDADHTSRWLSQVMSIEEGVYKIFPDEADWPTVGEMLTALTRYEVEPSTTAILYGALHKNDKHKFEKYAPNAQGEKTDG